MQTSFLKLSWIRNLFLFLSFIAFFPEFEAYGLGLTLSVYQKPGSKNLVFLIGDDHFLGSTELNQEQENQFVSLILEECRRNKIPFDFFVEDMYRYPINVGGSFQVLGTQKSKSRRVQVATKTSDSFNFGFNLPLVYEDETYILKKRMLLSMSSWIGLRYFHRDRSEFGESVSIQSIDPRFYTLFLLKEFPEIASLDDLWTLGNIERHRFASDFERLIQNNADLKREIEKIDRALSSDKGYIFSLLGSSFEQNRGKILSSPIQELIDQNLITTSQVSDIVSYINKFFPFFESVNKLALLNIERSLSMGHHAGVHMGGTHVVLVQRHLEAMNYIPIYKTPDFQGFYDFLQNDVVGYHTEQKRISTPSLRESTKRKKREGEGQEPVAYIKMVNSGKEVAEGHARSAVRGFMLDAFRLVRELLLSVSPDF